MWASNTVSLLLGLLVLQAAAHERNGQGTGFESQRIVRRGMRNFPRSYTLNYPLRSAADQDLIRQEFNTAAQMAAYAQANWAEKSQPYTSLFIAPSILNNANAQLPGEYGQAVLMGNMNDLSYQFTVTCDNTLQKCNQGYFASMFDSTNTMNLCDAWFNIAGTRADVPGARDLAATTTILAGCTGGNTAFGSLWDLWFGKAQGLLHELTHTTFFTGSSENTRDYAYGPEQCQNLAAGTKTMPESRQWIKSPQNPGTPNEISGIPLCPSEEDPTVTGVCNADFSIENADTLAIIAGAMWFSDAAQCSKPFEVGTQTPQTAASAKFKRQALDTEIIFDPPYNGYGFDSESCDTPDENDCCGECSPLPTTVVAPSSTILATNGPGCGTNLGQAPCSTAAATSAVNYNTVVTVTPSPTTTMAATSTTGGPLKQTAAGCADPNDVEECDRDENNDRPSCLTANDCDAPCRSQLSGNPAALQYSFASTCIDKAFCTCSVEVDEAVGEVLIELGEVICAVWNDAIPAALQLLQCVVPYVGELAEGAEAAEFFEAADQVLKKGSKDCNAACPESADGQKFTAVNPLDNTTWADIFPCDTESVPPS